jgi:ketosteroid isomerase-like protein
MRRMTIIATVLAVLALATSDVTARSHAAAQAEVSKALMDIRRAFMEADLDAIERLLDDDYTFIDGAGQLIPRYETMDAFIKKLTVIESWSYEGVNIRIYGTTAVVTGISNVQQRTMGKDTSGRFRFTRVFVKDAGQWRSVAMQATRM